MSWTIIVMHLPENIQSLNQLSKDFMPPPLGTRAELIDLLREVAPDLNVEHPHRLLVPSTGDDIEIGSKDPVVSFSIRNPSDEIISFLRANTSWTFIDALRGEVFTPKQPDDEAQ